MPVFLGGSKTLKEYHPALLFECHHGEALKGEIFRFLEAMNYTGVFFEKGEEHPVSDFDCIPYEKPTLSHRNYMFFFKA
jgi:hypothetical protein